MDYVIQSKSPEQQDNDCIVAAIGKSSTLLHTAQILDQSSQQHISNILKRGDMSGKLAENMMLQDVPHINAPRLLLLGCDNATELSVTQFHSIIQKMIQVLKSTTCQSVCFNIEDIQVKQRDTNWKIKQTIDIIEAAHYQFNPFKTKKESTNKTEPTPLNQFVFNLNPNSDQLAAQNAANEAQAISHGKHLCKDLGNHPGNICTPSYLAEQAKLLAENYTSITTEILDEAMMETLNMGALLSVSKGSRQPAKFIIIQHTGAGDEQPHVFIGKGVTFDAGGISIKPAAQMDEMKFDMCGGASVFGLMKTCAELNMPLNIIGVVPASENLPDGAANKPGDIVTSMSGQTIEILNTDAEGRLVLCDALTYCERFNPKTVVDVATLTGACVIALGNQASAVLSNHQPLADDLLAAGDDCYDRVWQMPLWEEYQKQLKSNFADLANIGGRPAGTITAACFLSKFTKYPWAHLDIAGTAWLSGSQKGATGRPVSLLTHYLLAQLK